MDKYNCQICGGPIVNGRCKWCGMPFRTDEVLYHLNESRSDHYRHATPEARKELRESSIPLGDMAKTRKDAGAAGNQKYKNSAAAGNQKYKNSAAAGNQKNKNSAAADSRKSASAAARQVKAAFGSSYNPAKYQTSKKPYDRPTVKGTTSKNITGVVVTVIILACALLPTGINYVKETYVNEFATGSHNIDLDDYVISGVLTRQDREVTVGEWIPAGRYMAEIDGGYCSFKIQREDNTETIYLSVNNMQHAVELHTGDIVSLHNVDTDERSVELYLIKEFDQ